MRNVAVGVLACIVALTTGCGAGDRSHAAPPKEATDAAGPASQGPPPGYVRFATMPVTVPAGVSNQWMQWVQSPLDHDVDIVDIQGTQSSGGHHAVLYATSDIQPVGTVQPWKDSNIASAHFLGGIGGEGASALRLPEAAVFRLRAGQALALQTHYLNAGSQDLQGTTQLDVKFGDASASDQLASMLVNTALNFQVPPQSSLHVDVSCKIGQDVSVLMFSNHLHQWGTATTTSVTDATGAASVLKSDPVWNSEWTTNPNFTKFTVDAPLPLQSGESLTTSCDWTNTTNQPLSFPAEMCVFIAFYLGDNDVGCVNGGAFNTLTGP